MELSDKIKKFVVGTIVGLALCVTANKIDDNIIKPENHNAPAVTDPVLKPNYAQIKEEEPVLQVEPEIKREMPPIASYFPLYYPKGDIGYVEDVYNISMDWVISRETKQGDTLEKYLRMEGVSPAEIRLYQRVFLTINDSSYYPKGYDRKFEITEGDIILRIGKIANYEDLNRSGSIFGEPGTYLFVDGVKKITDQKNNYGELMLNGTNRR
jgi:hypothetical protein